MIRLSRISENGSDRSVVESVGTFFGARILSVCMRILRSNFSNYKDNPPSGKGERTIELTSEIFRLKINFKKNYDLKCILLISCYDYTLLIFCPQFKGSSVLFWFAPSDIIFSFFTNIHHAKCSIPAHHIMLSIFPHISPTLSAFATKDFKLALVACDVVLQAILASLQASLALFTAVFLDRFNPNLATLAPHAISPAIASTILAISHCFQLVIISHNFLIISVHLSQRSSKTARDGFCSTSSFILISASVRVFGSSESHNL